MSPRCSALPLKSTSQGFAATACGHSCPQSWDIGLGHGCCGDGERHIADTIAACISRMGGRDEEVEMGGETRRGCKKLGWVGWRSKTSRMHLGQEEAPALRGLCRGKGAGVPGGVSWGEGPCVVAEAGGFHSSTGSCQAHTRTMWWGWSCWWDMSPGAVPPGRLSPSAATGAAHASKPSK